MSTSLLSSSWKSRSQMSVTAARTGTTAASCCGSAARAGGFSSNSIDGAACSGK
eukprot:CAMPEP_0179085008 /NCGR_PEP_ID=MMETSP0796-20121207/38474_1 /TAXON_ID=73915 /ORGANISM="Pyrodinium bahamense, Strain pbaha01" /LENGTH=53 /DNA_ID=CAMNT_0020782437 /DNA_START=928 /DNA_END=1089 /DNA_ORIENTATION=+